MSLTLEEKASYAATRARENEAAKHFYEAEKERMERMLAPLRRPALYSHPAILEGLAQEQRTYLDKARIQALHDQIPAEWDARPISLAHEIRAFLRTISDEGIGVDSGGGDGSADLWVWVGGREFYINIRPSEVQTDAE